MAASSATAVAGWSRLAVLALAKAGDCLEEKERRVGSEHRVERVASWLSAASVRWERGRECQEVSVCRAEREGTAATREAAVAGWAMSVLVVGQTAAEEVGWDWAGLGRRRRAKLASPDSGARKAMAASAVVARLL